MNAEATAHPMTTDNRSSLARLARFTSRHRWPVIAAWVVLTLIGGIAAGKLSSRWYQSFSIPGKSAYEASQRNAQGVRGRREAARRRRVPHERRRDQEPGRPRRDAAGGGCESRAR